jgi:uncharacterized coiled-coil DUF342 family protein
MNKFDVIMAEFFNAHIEPSDDLKDVAKTLTEMNFNTSDLETNPYYRGALAGLQIFKFLEKEIEDKISILETKVQFLEPYKEMYEECKKERDTFRETLVSERLHSDELDEQYKVIVTSLKEEKEEVKRLKTLVKQLQESAYEASETIEEAKDIINHFVYGDNMRHEGIKWIQAVEKKIIGE